MSIRVAYRFSILGLLLALVGCSRDPVDNLISQLDDPDVETRRTAARALADRSTADDRAIGALTKSAADSDAEVRRLSIEALGKLGPAAKSSLPALKSAL